MLDFLCQQCMQWLNVSRAWPTQPGALRMDAQVLVHVHMHCSEVVTLLIPYAPINQPGAPAVPVSCSQLTCCTKAVTHEPLFYSILLSMARGGRGGRRGGGRAPRKPLQRKSQHVEKDDDMMYDEVDRHHHRKQTLSMNVSDDAADSADDSALDDEAAVFDVAADDESSSEEDDEEALEEDIERGGRTAQSEFPLAHPHPLLSPGPSPHRPRLKDINRTAAI